MPRFAWVASVATVGTVALCAWLIAGWGGSYVRLTVDDLGFVALSIFATSCAWYAARKSRGRQRAAWTCFTLGLACWTAGSVIWAYYEWWLGVSPYPTLADAGYLLLPLFLAAGLLFLPVGASGYTYTRLALDGLIVAAALLQIAWLTVLQDLFDAGSASPFDIALSLAYPIADVIVLTMALLVFGRGRTGRRTVLALLTVGVIAFYFADCVFVYMTSHDDYSAVAYGDVGWAVGLLFISLAALMRSHTPDYEIEVAKVPSHLALWVPYVPLLIAVVIGVWKLSAIPGLIPALAVSVLLMLAVLVRQVIVVGENRRLLATVEAQAMRDPLTGLANRALFQDRLTHAVLLHRWDKQSVAVLSLDLDDFKMVNDGLGHLAGDVLLIGVAERILGAARSSDTVARLGGDEFAVLLEGDVDQSFEVAQRITAAFEEPFDVDGHHLLLRPSAGMAIATPEDPELSAEELMDRADVAMYSAKRGRVSGVQVFSADMSRGGGDLNGRPVDGAAALQLLGELRSAIDGRDLVLRYQPKVDLEDGSIVGVEALVRWPHPERGLLAPDEFLPLVREHGLMPSVTELVVSQALDQVAEWRAEGAAISVAVNLFAPSLADLTLPDRIVWALGERGLPSDALTVEVTEDLLLDDLDRTRTVIERLRANGVRVAIDDFGSGYSTLSYLRDLSVDEIKLDHDFVSAVRGERRAGAIVRAVIALAHELGLTTVAEGVEDAETVALLRDYGCRYAQGFYYSEPRPAEDIRELFISRRPEPSAVRSN